MKAAHELFVERDYDEVSTDEILARSGVSRGAMYHHFPAKLDLFRAVYEASEQRAIGLVADELATASDLRRIGLTQSRAVLGWSGWREAATGLGIGVVHALVSSAIEAGQMSRRDSETTAHVLLGALIEAAMLIVVAEDPAVARERSEAVVVDLIEGLRSQPGTVCSG